MSSGPYASQRPDSCQSSAGVRMGTIISWAPIASISSRMTASILRIERHASGR